MRETESRSRSKT